MKYKLKDLCTTITDGSHFSPKAQSCGFPMLSVKDMREYDFSYENCKRISNEDFLILKKNGCVPQKGDVLVAKDGSYLKEIFVCKENKNEAVLSSIAIFRPNTNLITSEFLCYLLKSPGVFNYIKNNCVSGSALPRIVLKTFKEIILDVPDIETQIRICGVLNPIDAQIISNREINDNLSKQIQLLFKSNFVDSPYDFVPCKIGNLPIFITDYVANGSFASLKENVTLLDEPNFAYFIRNTDLKSGKFNIFVDEHSYNFLAKSSLYGNEIIVSNVGDIGSVFLCPFLNKPMTLGNNVIMIRPRKKELLYFMFIWLKWFDGQQLIQGIKGGSAVPKFNKTEFKNIVINIPHDKQLASFDNLVKPMFEKMRFLEEENLKLSNLRDSLLPKLMSGEIDVDSIEL